MGLEILDVFDDNYLKIGEASHAVVHQNGLWHRAVHCWLVDQSSGNILYQRRSARKRLYANMLDVSVAGHCRSSESPEEALTREAMEELGLTIGRDRVTPIGIRRNAFAGDDIINREFQHVYVGYLPCKMYDLAFRDGEVSSVLLLKPEEVIDILERGSSALSEAWDGQSRAMVTVGRNDFITSIDDYDLKIAVQIQRWLAGEQHILI